MVSPGDRVTVRVLEVKLDKKQIALSMKTERARRHTPAVSPTPADRPAERAPRLSRPCPGRPPASPRRPRAGAGARAPLQQPVRRPGEAARQVAAGRTRRPVQLPTLALLQLSPNASMLSPPRTRHRRHFVGAALHGGERRAAGATHSDSEVAAPTFSAEPRVHVRDQRGAANAILLISSPERPAKPTTTWLAGQSGRRGGASLAAGGERDARATPTGADRTGDIDGAAALIRRCAPAGWPRRGRPRTRSGPGPRDSVVVGGAAGRASH